MHRRIITTSRLVSTAAALTVAAGLSVGALGASSVAIAADDCSAYGSVCPTPTTTILTPSPTVTPTTTLPPIPPVSPTTSPVGTPTPAVTTSPTTAPVVTTTHTPTKPLVKTTTPTASPTKTPVVLPTTVSTPSVKGTTLTKTPEGSSLPFTGGEFVLMSTAGLAALGAGVSLVVISRRRRSA